MSKSIIQSIAAIVAAGVWPKVYHPEWGTNQLYSIRQDEPGQGIITLMSPDGKYLKFMEAPYHHKQQSFEGLRIPRNPFSDLVERVKADPQSNPAVEANPEEFREPQWAEVPKWSKGKQVSLWYKDGEGVSQLAWTINDLWHIESGDFVISSGHFSRLLAAGYPVGIDPDHVIFEEEIK